MADNLRRLTDHIVMGGGSPLEVLVVDEKGAGGAHHLYETLDSEGKLLGLVKFQNGPIAEAGINGVTHESLLAILIDRLACFQAGPYSSRFNAIAKTHLEEALMWLQKRTVERMQRGVEGTSAL